MDTADIIALDAVETIEITELTPSDGSFVGKRILRNGSISPYPMVKNWRQAVAQIPATPIALFDYLREAQTRNICLIRGTPANLARKNTRRQIARGDRGDHGFTDEPTALHFFDVDGAAGNWKADPEAAVKRIVAQLGEPFASASYVWFFSAGHGLKMETVEIGEKKAKRWCGAIDDSKIRVRLAFILDRALTWREAAALTDIVKAASGLPLDDAICRTVQPNYIARPRQDGHPGCDVLGDIRTIGWVGGATCITSVAAPAAVTVTTTVTVAVPDDLAHQARWAQAQGHGVVIADHPDVLSAVCGIGSDGRIRQHMMAAIAHLLKANPPRDHVSYLDHGLTLADKLQAMITEHSKAIEAQLAAHGRQWGDLTGYLGGMADWARWLMERPGALNRKTVKLARTEHPEIAQAGAQAIFDRVATTIDTHTRGQPSLYNNIMRQIKHQEPLPHEVRLLIAPTGSRKSTEIRKAAVWMVAGHPDRASDSCVVILVPRHKLGIEQIEALHHEHPDKRFVTKAWRGRQREDPEFIGPQRPGKEKLMCWRPEEARALENVLLDVESNLCKKGRGDAAVTCRFYRYCGAQRQKLARADIWLAAHELMAHKPPKTFGYVGRVMIDESPLDAFLFGTDITDEMTLEISELKAPPARGFNGELTLMDGREALHEALCTMKLPADPHRGVPISIEDLEQFATREIEGELSDFIFASLQGHALHNPKLLAALEWKDKVEPHIQPDWPAKKVQEALAAAAGNARIRKLVMLWKLLADGKAGRLQLHNSDRGRIIRMVGLRQPAEGWDVPTLITDATGDAHLLRGVWPDLACDVEQWQQLPRPASVRIFQCVDRAISKYAVAIEGEDEQLKRRERAARRLYAAILTKALGYGGAEVGVITYKSTREWIEDNCFVPEWLKLFHHGDVTGTNTLSNVRALFVIGRPLASAEAVTRMTEALFGDYIATREYRTIRKGGRIPIVPDAGGNNTVLVDIWQHPAPRAERIRRQVTEGNLIQDVGRARAGLRGDSDPLDIHLWTDVPLPELGPVEPVLWDEVAGGLDELMLATGGVWLENATHAAKAYQEEGLFTAKNLEQMRRRARTQASFRPENAAGARTPFFLYYNLTIGKEGTPLVSYQLPGAGQKPARAVSLLGLNETRAWLEARLRPLTQFHVGRVSDPEAMAAE